MPKVKHSILQKISARLGIKNATANRENQDPTLATASLETDTVASLTRGPKNTNRWVYQENTVQSVLKEKVKGANAAADSTESAHCARDLGDGG